MESGIDKMNWQLLIPLTAATLLAIGGWLAGRYLNARRDSRDERKKFRMEYLIDAYRRLEDACCRGSLYNTKIGKGMESALADIQLFGSAEQVGMANELSASISARRADASAEPLLKSLRDELRRELCLNAVDGEPVRFRLRKEDRSDDEGFFRLRPARIETVRDEGEDVDAPIQKDIRDEFRESGRDPADDPGALALRDDVRTMEDLTEGMEIEGLVTAVTEFGAFVDIGVRQNGLVHISELADRFVRDPADVVKPGDRIKVRVLGVDLERKRINLSARTGAPKPDSRPARKPRTERRKDFSYRPFADFFEKKEGGEDPPR
jgi:predicted RNA-binding protein with RPS1 domain